MGDFEALGLLEPEPLSASHDVPGFDSGRPSLDIWLREMAPSNQRENYTRTFVVADPQKRVQAYYALCAGMLLRSEAPRALAPHGAPPELPVALLARLAVSVGMQGRGLGRALLANALHRVRVASETIAFRGLLVDALDEDAAAFYRSLGFRPTKLGRLRLVLPMQDILASGKL